MTNPIKVSSHIFSGGEVQVKLSAIDKWDSTHILLTRIQDANSIMNLLLANEVLDRLRLTRSVKRLIIPYFPYARQDRVMVPEEAFSLKVFAKLINDMKFDEVVTYDTHSDVTAALVERLNIVTQRDIVTKLYQGLDEWVYTNQPVIISPDAGAYKKASQIAAHYKANLAIGHKMRDVISGEISGISVYGDVKDKNVLIVDDICDGGRTFTELGKQLKNNGAKTVALYITHGIFSKGYDVFNRCVDRIYTTDTFIPKDQSLPDQVPVFVSRLNYLEV